MSKQTTEPTIQTMNACCVRAVAAVLLLTFTHHFTMDRLLFRIFYFFFILFSFVCLGIVLIVNASEDFENTEELRENGKSKEYVDTEEAIDIGLIISGIFLTLFGFVLIALYIKVAEWRRNCICPCGLSKKQGLARQLQSGAGGTQLPLNPSTDPLVSHTQYAPISELPRPDDEECRTLMNKDWYANKYKQFAAFSRNEN